MNFCSLSGPDDHGEMWRKRPHGDCLEPKRTLANATGMPGTSWRKVKEEWRGK
jgi:hypothetical protein